MPQSNNSRMKSVGVTVFAYSFSSLVSFPSSVGMGPSRLFPESHLPTRAIHEKRERRQQCGSRCSTVNNSCMKSVGVVGLAYSSFSLVSFPSSVGMGPSRFLPLRSLPTRWRSDQKEEGVSDVAVSWAFAKEGEGSGCGGSSSTLTATCTVQWALAAPYSPGTLSCRRSWCLLLAAHAEFNSEGRVHATHPGHPPTHPHAPTCSSDNF